MKKSTAMIALLLSLSTFSFSKLKVENIKINNLVNLDEEYVKEKLPVKVGDDYSNRLLSDIYQKLREEQIISNVIINPKIEGENVTLNISVDEVSNAKELLERQQAIKEAQKKTEFIIKEINIIGNKNTDVSEIMSKIPLKKGEYFVPYNVDLSLKQMISTGLYKEIVPEVLRTADGKEVVINIKVTENPVVKSLSIIGSEIFTESDLIKASNIEVGKVLNMNYLNPETMPLLSVYTQSGVMSAGVSDIKISEDGDVLIQLFEGKVGEIKIKKLVQRKDNERRNSDKYRLKTQDYIFDRALKVSEGDILTEQGISESLKELQRTGLFTSIVPNFVQTDTGETNIELMVAERPTTSINASVSYTTTDGLLGGIKLSDTNFLGRAQELSLNFEFGTKGNFTAEFSFFDPWIQDTDRLQAGFSASVSRQRGTESDFTKLRDTAEDSEKSKEEQDKAKQELLNKEYVKYVYNVSGSVGKGIYNDMYITLKPKIQGVYSSNYYGQKLNDYTLISVSPSIIYDTRDNSFTPKNGVYLQLTDELGYIFRNNSSTYDLEGNESENIKTTGLYNKIEADMKFYHPVYKDKNSMAYHINLGYATEQSQERFSNSSGSVFRGTQNVLQGKEKVIFSLENRTYISDYVQAVLFIDAGNIYEPEQRKQAWQFENISKSFGAGVRLNTPLGVIRLDYGWPIIKSPITDNYKVGRGKLSFGFGQTF